MTDYFDFALEDIFLVLNRTALLGSADASRIVLTVTAGP